MTTGDQLRDEGVDRNLDTAEGHMGAALLRAALDTLIDHGREFTADHVRDMAGDPPTHHPNVLPSLISHAARSGRIRAVGYRRSTRRARHSGVCRTWTANTRRKELP